MLKKPMHEDAVSAFAQLVVGALQSLRGVEDHGPVHARADIYYTQSLD